eukprot:jgi/Tetstr1/421934/TSEL_012833.t1
MAFRRPGSTSAASFGVKFDVDRDSKEQQEPSPAVLALRDTHLGVEEQRRRLPIAELRTALLYLVEKHATVVVLGETGSGKTTQLPQFLHEAGWTAGGRQIAITQPRRVPVMTVSSRVAEEAGCALGDTVGYTIRFDDKTSKERTRIKFLTDGVLIREMSENPLLPQYSVIMIDEAHERSIATDILLGLLKKVQKKRPELRIVISSATLEAEKMAAFFDMSRAPRPAGDDMPDRKPAIISVAGRMHNVTCHYLQDPCSNYVQAAVEATMNVHKEGLPGDVLIFLTGQAEIESAVDMIREESRKLPGGVRVLAMPLYSGLPAEQQLAVFQPTPRNSRKVVVATNIAETSVTIEGITYVIDCLFTKLRVYNPMSGLESLMIAPVSKACAIQRTGRAGRVRPGHCFRLCTKEAFDALTDTTVPEVQRSELAGTMLQLKTLGIDNLHKFEWLSPPPAEAMIRALELLHALGALDDDAKLSFPMGESMAELPVEPMLARSLLVSGKMGCSVEMIVIASCLSVKSVWISGRGKELQEAKARFAVAEGDLVTYINVVKAWEMHKRSRQWCEKNCVDHRAMLRAADIRLQVQKTLGRLGVPLVSCSPDIEVLRRAITAGFFFNAARLVEYQAKDFLDRGLPRFQLVRKTGVGVPLQLTVHPSSCLYRCKPSWIVYGMVQQTAEGGFEAQDVTSIEPEWLAELAPHMFANTPGNKR